MGLKYGWLEPLFGEGAMLRQADIRVVMQLGCPALRTGVRDAILWPDEKAPADHGREVEVEPAPDSANPERQLANVQLSRRIQVALMGMATTDRLVLTLRHFSELSYEEMGQVLDLDEKTVKSRLFEARQRLRHLLKDLRAD